MDSQAFRDRTKQLGLRVIRLAGALPKDTAAQVLGKQIVRSATSVGANYRAACRARSRADMIAKLKIVEEEADETVYWMEVLAEAGFVKTPQLEPLQTEANEIVAMTVASIKTLRNKPETTQVRKS